MTGESSYLRTKLENVPGGSGWRYVVRLLEYRDGEPYIVSAEGGMDYNEMRQQVDTLIQHVSQIYRVEIERYDPAEVNDA